MGTKGEKIKQTNKPVFLRAQVKEQTVISERGFQSKKVCGEGVIQGVIVCQLGAETQRKYSLSAAHCWIRDLSQQYQILKLCNRDKTNYQNTRKKEVIFRKQRFRSE